MCSNYDRWEKVEGKEGGKQVEKVGVGESREKKEV